MFEQLMRRLRDRRGVRFNPKLTDTERVGMFVGRVTGRRLTYRQPADV